MMTTYAMHISGHGSHGRRQAWTLWAAAALAATSMACHSRSSKSGAGASEEQMLRDRIAFLGRQEQLLTTEIALAKSQAPYVTLDLANRRIELRVQGHSLRSFPVNRITREGGAAFVAQTWTETEAKPRQAPVREKVIPGSGEATTASTATRDPWGPKRMPSDYDLICRGDRVLQVRSLLTDQSRFAVTRWIVSNYRLAREWVRTTLGGKNAAAQESIEIWMGEQDARLLFWSLPRQFEILLVN